ncbi:hypothetical protein NPIL_643131 [Nephila pilipes]|uniref:Uncharacterized protein n=1 Tax=Nephila pilipes TaxID=299642 RepID=A0A8X6U741_NEPPI|nr:hypothetical protein NPIL_643131 [Nephila pilipes]
MRLLTDSIDDIKESSERQNIEIDTEGTVSKEIVINSSLEEPPLHTIFNDVSGLTGHAKRNKMMDKEHAAFYLLFDYNIMENFIKYKKIEAQRVLEK